LASDEHERLTLAYNPRLDGLRAVAVLLVFALHAGIPGLGGGAYGVDLFFVLSGFLITQVLQKDGRHKHALSHFYWRRFLRLVPASAFLCCALGMASLLMPSLVDRTTALNDIGASLLSVANWTRAFSLGPPTYLGNCWSLSIEEQFYLVWPLLFLFFLRKGRENEGRGLTLILWVVSMAWPIALMVGGASRDRLFNGFDTHCNGLLLGCLWALGRPGPKTRRLVARLSPFAVALLGAGVALQPEATVVGYLVMPLVGLVLIAVAQTERPTLLGRFLQTPVLVGLGKISYAVYLWHYPIMLIMDLHHMGWRARTFGGGMATLAAALISWHFIERPLQRLRHAKNLPLHRLGLATASLSLVGLLTGTGLFLRTTLVDALTTGPIVVTNYDPKTLVVGSSFNLQPSGDSYLWMNVSRTLPHEARLRLDAQPTKTSVTGRGLSALLPRALLDQVGVHEMTIIDGQGQPMAPSVTLVITPKEP
jgi:peptidoglycan/LPS O-acetylase OafA/YrhL